MTSMKKKIVDVTVGNRCNVDDPRDPGGRLGPYKGNGQPDLRNLDMFSVGCNDKDIIILVSDGVHDNLDPSHMGLSPKDKSVGLNYDNWADVPVEESLEAKTKFMDNYYSKIIKEEAQKCGQEVTPSLICQKSIRHCRDLTSSSRQWMEQNPNGVLVHDYVRFPGKLDHTTCVCYQVGTYVPGQNDIPVQSLDTAIWPF